MAKIHPSAIIDPEVQLADDVEIGAGCVLQGPVKIAAGNRLLAHVHLQGPVTLGTGNTLYPCVCVGFPPQDRKFHGGSAGVFIGNNNCFRESVTIHAASNLDHPTTIGDDNYLMTNSHLGHDVVLGNQCTLASGAMVGGHANVGDQVNLGGNAAIHQFCHVGRLSMLGGLSGVAMDLPPFLIAIGINKVMGLNRIGLRRSGIPSPAIDVLDSAFDLLYHHAHSNVVAIEAIEKLAHSNETGRELLLEVVAFLRASRRGLVPHTSTATRQKLQR